MRGNQARGAEAGDGAETEADDGHGGHLVRHQVKRGRLAQSTWQVRASGRLDCLDRPAAARAFDQADDRHAVLGRDLLRHLGLALDGSVRRSATQREVVTGDDHRAAIDQPASEHAVTGHELGDVALEVVRRLAGDAADFLEGARIEHLVDPFPHRQAAALVLACDPLLTAHLSGNGLAEPQFLQLRLPSDRRCLGRLVGGRLRAKRRAVVGHAFPVLGYPKTGQPRRLIGGPQRFQISSAVFPAFRRKAVSPIKTISMVEPAPGSSVGTTYEK